MHTRHKFYLYRRENGYYYIGYTLGNKVRWKSTHSKNKTDALQVLSEFKTTPQETPHTPLLSSFTDDFLTFAEKTYCKSTIDIFRIALGHLKIITGDITLAGITPKHVDFYKTKITGWNLIGSISEPISVSTLSSIPPGIITSQIFGYEGGYTAFDTIFPGKAYWIKVDQPGQLILSSETSGSLFNRIKITPISELPPRPPEESVFIEEQIPTEFILSQNYPNPFNPVTKITYSLPVRSTVKVEIFNMLGQNVSILVNGDKETGYHSVEWNAPVGAGMYFYRMTAVCVSNPSKSFTQVKKMLLVK